jgi:4-hydroxy-3-methylbut-2-enyl diphosphate reductase
MRVIGLTAGASAPPRLVEGVIEALAGLGPVTAAERELTRETIHFTVPSVLGPGARAAREGQARSATTDPVANPR